MSRLLTQIGALVLDQAQRHARGQYLGLGCAPACISDLGRLQLQLRFTLRSSHQFQRLLGFPHLQPGQPGVAPDLHTASQERLLRYVRFALCTLAAQPALAAARKLLHYADRELCIAFVLQRVAVGTVHGQI